MPCTSIGEFWAHFSRDHVLWEAHPAFFLRWTLWALESLLRLERTFVCRDVCSGYPGLWRYECSLVTSDLTQGNEQQKTEKWNIQSLWIMENFVNWSQPDPLRSKPGGDGGRRGKIVRYPKDTFPFSSWERFKVVSQDKHIPRCPKMGRVQSDGTKWFPERSGT